MSKRKNYLFSLGNSTDGPVGFCVRVIAPSKKVALQKLKEALPQDLELESFVDPDEGPDTARVEYFNVYINPDAITVKDIEDSETEDANDE